MTFPSEDPVVQVDPHPSTVVAFCRPERVPPAGTHDDLGTVTVPAARDTGAAWVLLQPLLAAVDVTPATPFAFALRRDQAGVADLVVRWDGETLALELRVGEDVTGGWTLDGAGLPVSFTVGTLVVAVAPERQEQAACEVVTWLVDVLPAFEDLDDVRLEHL